MPRVLSQRFVFGVVALLAALAANAQPYATGYIGGYSRPYYGGYGYGGYGYGGSTVAGSYLNGMASAIRAEGQYNLLSSQAAINLEEATKQDIENRQRWTSAYFEMRKINQAYTDAQRSPRLSNEEWVRLAHDAVPPRLPTTALDPVSGGINWPSALQTPPFLADRQVLDTLYAERAVSHGAIGVDMHAKIRVTVDAMLGKLKDQIRELDTKSYLDARNFLTSLGREADFPSSG